MKPALPALAAFCLISACAAEPTPPSITSYDVDRAFVEARRIESLPFAASGDIPTGSATYDGQIGADVRGDSNGSILADMTMIVGFDSNTINGNVTNINLVDPDGIPNQRFSGALSITGIENNGALDAVASGRIGAVDLDGYEVEADMDLDLNGAVRNDRDFGDAIYGSATGTAEGDFYLDVDGVFFGTKR